MKYIPFLILLVSSLAFADSTEKYLWEDKDGNIRLTCYVPGSTDSVESVLKENGFQGGKLVQVQDNDPILLEDNSYLKFMGNKPVVDQVKKDAGEADKMRRADERKAIFIKLGITEEEFKKL